MPHEHLGFQLFRSFHSHADHNEHAGGTKHAGNVEAVQDNSGNDGDNGEIQRTEQGQTVGLPGRMPGIKPPFCCRFLLISTGLKVMEE